jgi:hypothetical protein
MLCLFYVLKSIVYVAIALVLLYIIFNFFSINKEKFSIKKKIKNAVDAQKKADNKNMKILIDQATEQQKQLDNELTRVKITESTATQKNKDAIKLKNAVLAQEEDAIELRNIVMTQEETYAEKLKNAVLAQEETCAKKLKNAVIAQEEEDAVKQEKARKQQAEKNFAEIKKQQTSDSIRLSNAMLYAFEQQKSVDDKILAAYRAQFFSRDVSKNVRSTDKQKASAATYYTKMNNEATDAEESLQKLKARIKVLADPDTYNS